MVNCCILGCESRSERNVKNITFHIFPKDLGLMKEWVAATGRQNWNPSKYTRVCSKHFDAQCFRKTKKLTILRNGSVPKLFVHQLIPVLDQTNPSTCNMPQTESPTDDCQQSAHCSTGISQSSMIPISRSLESDQIPMEYTPKKIRLYKELQHKTLLADKRKKKISVLRAKNWRLTKRNAELSDVIAQLQSR